MNVLDNITAKNLNVKSNDAPNANKQVHQSTNLPENKPDTFNGKTVNKSNRNKKLLFLGITLGIATGIAFVYRKNIADFFKNQIKPIFKRTKDNIPDTIQEVKNIQTPQTTTPIKTVDTVDYKKLLESANLPTELENLKENKTSKEEFIKNYKDALLGYSKSQSGYYPTGVCFYGPDSILKDNAVETFVSDLESCCNFRVKRIPNNIDGNDITLAIADTINDAKQHFKKTNQRTAIVVKNLDKIAQDRNQTIENVSTISTLLVEIPNAREEGFTWISEAKDMLKVDPAVHRAGRIDKKILCPPTINDAKEVWQGYIDALKYKLNLCGREKNIEQYKQMIKDAEEIIRKYKN